MSATKTKTKKHNLKMAKKDNPALRPKPKEKVIIISYPKLSVADARDGL